MDKYTLSIMGLTFLVDLLLLRGAAEGDRSLQTAVRTIGAAALGGIYSGACTMPNLHFLGNPVCAFACLVLMALLAFGFQNRWLQKSGMFLFLWLAVSGMAAGLEEKDRWFPVLACALLCLLILMGPDGGKGKQYVLVCIRYGGKVVQLTALADNGNLLRDPVSGESVLIVSPKIGIDLLGLTQSQLSDPVGAVACGQVPGLRLIPYSAVGQPGGLLTAIRFSNVTIDGRSGTAIVAFSPNPIGDGRRFEALAGGMA